ncbi:hypothetical protein SDRG_06171 [Saprolegnia diclina VS20]|uniref:MYND-type domain-containing protein n=1 Tax=Saprolegnia diclina (strain VS20) TaxID=1156394 RepID=T0QRX0_SAPDV|nr:hypothetical protein SDRG_06171 [Saprolegnia diclina VS20]EQC36735.1 hypothetical protein SDRG_06171 [Saprolegnia diclina VS20]|eukprot:XP_008610156.1 hypothetical protein SDRG_06171 [Saprolegnia diclina VS20]
MNLDTLNATLPADARVRCVEHPVFGVSLVATEAIAVGDLVWAEEAALVRPGSSLLDYVKLLRAHDASALAAILSQFMTLSSAAIDSDPLFGTIKTYCDALKKADRTLVCQLVSAFEVNGHGLNGEIAGLFSIASKAAHSCSPNVVYRPVGVQGMAYTAIKPIPAGSLILYSYIAREKLGYPSHVRQAFLQQAYYFTCGCDRCSAPDDMRPLPCPACAAPTLLYNPVTLQWVCTSCAVVTPEAALGDAVAVEEAIENQVLAFDIDPATATPDGVRHVLTMLEALAAPNHWAAIYLWRILVEMSLPPSTEHMAPPLPMAKVQAVTMRIARWCDDVLATYNPVSAAMLIFTYRSVLYKLCDREPQVLALLTRLYPYFRLNFGANDEDVVEWRALVLTNDVATAELSHCAGCAAPRTGALACARCKCVAYCSKACQVRDWKEGGHKAACRQLSAQCYIVS